MPTSKNFYNQDLAYVHDTGFGDFARKSGPGLLKLFQKHRLSNGLIVDLGCGSGILAGQFTNAGYQVLGIDASAAMIALAKKNAPRADFRIASIYTSTIPDCFAVTSIGECLNYMPNRPAPLKSLFQIIYNALNTGGVFVFDIAEPGQISAGTVVKTFTEGKGWTVLVEKQESAKTGILIRRIITFRKHGAHYRRTVEIHKQKLYKSAVMVKMLREAGFRVTVLDSYGKFRLPPAHKAFVAAK